MITVGIWGIWNRLLTPNNPRTSCVVLTMFIRQSYGRPAMRGFRKAFVKILDKTIDLAATYERSTNAGFSYGCLKKPVRNGKKNKNVNDVALIRHLATSNIANFMWYNFLLVKK